MERTVILFSVTYVDDCNRKHLTFVKSLAEVNFLKDRFEHVTYEVTRYCEVEPVL